MGGTEGVSTKDEPFYLLTLMPINLLIMLNNRPNFIFPLDNFTSTSLDVARVDLYSKIYLAIYAPCISSGGPNDYNRLTGIGHKTFLILY